MSQFDQVSLRLAIDPPRDGDDLAAHLAFLRGATLSAYSTTPLRRDTIYMIAMDVPPEWGKEAREAFAAEFERALRLMRGMPWLGVREVLAYMAAEDAVQRIGDEQASQMFALLRKTPTDGWGEILEPVIGRVRLYAEEAEKHLAVTAALGSLRGLWALVSQFIGP